MAQTKHILMIGTNGIDCFYNIAQAFDQKSARVIQTHSVDMASTYLDEQSFDAILINLEPNGKGGIDGVDALAKIIESDNNRDAVCFSVSAASASALLTANVEYLSALSVVVGWLALPVKHEKAVKLILDILESPNNFSVAQRLAAAAGK